MVPKENEAINEVWLSDRDRFSYEGLSHSERLRKPKIKRGRQIGLKLFHGKKLLIAW